MLHCGECAACSTLHDLDVLNSTRTYITSKLTACAAAFAKPSWLGGHRDRPTLERCMREAGIGFSEDGGAWSAPAHRPSCMDCWTDNVACDAVQCVTNPDCIWKFFDPHNSGAFAGCVKCDELHCGPEFIRCAGANRRSSGIHSDIARSGPEVCPVGFFS